MDDELASDDKFTFKDKFENIDRMMSDVEDITKGYLKVFGYLREQKNPSSDGFNYAVSSYYCLMKEALNAFEGKRENE